MESCKTPYITLNDFYIVYQEDNLMLKVVLLRELEGTKGIPKSFNGHPSETKTICSQLA
jgi:hypothetical protein